MSRAGRRTAPLPPRRQGGRAGAGRGRAPHRRADDAAAARSAAGSGPANTHPLETGTIAFRRAQHRRSRRARGRRRRRAAAGAPPRGGWRDLRDRDPGDGPVTVHFIGAGPGPPDLITLRGRHLIASSPVCLYAGSLVPKALLGHCPPGALIVDTAPLDLDAIVKLCVDATAEGKDVSRLHSGDLSIWSAMGEQLRRLDKAGVPYTVTPRVPAFAAA